MPKLSELPADTTLAAADVLAIVSDGATKKITAPDFLLRAAELVDFAHRTAPHDFTNRTAAFKIDGEQTVTASVLWSAIGGYVDYRADTTNAGTTGHPELQASAGEFYMRTYGKKGTTHALNAINLVDGAGVGGSDGEAASIFSFLRSESSVTNLWGLDLHAHGPTDRQARQIGGIICMVGNYHADPLTHYSTGIAVQTYPGIGRAADVTTYPNDFGILVNGRASSGQGWKVGVQAGGDDGPWWVSGTRIGTGFKALMFEEYGLHISTPYSGSSPVAVAVDASAGNSGFGVLAPKQKVEVNGGMRLETATSKPAANADSAGTIWRTKGGAGAADVVEMCLKAADGSYSWKPIATG